MANWMKVDADQLDADLTTVADAIRQRHGDGRKLAFPDGYTDDITEFYNSVVGLINRNVGTFSFKVPNGCTKLGGDAFRSCSALVSVAIPDSVTAIGSYVFLGCSKLTDILFPSKSFSIQVQAFGNCSALTYIDLRVCSGMNTGVFNGCTKLATVISRRTSAILPLPAINVFTNTPFASGKAGGILLAPSALIETYKNATNWSVIYGYGTNKFLPLEEYTVDGTVTGEIDWEKVEAAREAAA